MFDFWFGLIENKPLAEWKPSLGPKIQEKWGKIFLITTLCFFCISIFGWTICCVCPSTYESTIPLVQTKGCLHSSTGTTWEVVMDIPTCQTYGWSASVLVWTLLQVFVTKGSAVHDLKTKENKERESGNMNSKGEIWKQTESQRGKHTKTGIPH